LPVWRISRNADGSVGALDYARKPETIGQESILDNRIGQRIPPWRSDIVHGNTHPGDGADRGENHAADNTLLQCTLLQWRETACNQRIRNVISRYTRCESGLHQLVREGDPDALRKYLQGKPARCRRLAGSARKDPDRHCLDCPGPQGQTPLQIAADIGDDVRRKACVMLLLTYGAWIDAPGVNGGTALHRAVLRRHLDTAGYLLARGARIDIRDGREQHVLDLAHKTLWPDKFEWLVRRAVDAGKAREVGELMRDAIARNDTPLIEALHDCVRADKWWADMAGFLALARAGGREALRRKPLYASAFADVVRWWCGMPTQQGKLADKAIWKRIEQDEPATGALHAWLAALAYRPGRYCLVQEYLQQRVATVLDALATSAPLRREVLSMLALSRDDAKKHPVHMLDRIDCLCASHLSETVLGPGETA
jgi:hypothetical protein